MGSFEAGTEDEYQIYMINIFWSSEYLYVSYKSQYHSSIKMFEGSYIEFWKTNTIAIPIVNKEDYMNFTKMLLGMSIQLC